MALLHGKITGLGAALPSRVLTNADLEKMVETNDEWIVTRTGIKERRVLAENETITGLCVKAAQEALSVAKIGVDDLDLIINCTFTPEFYLPAGACLIQDQLGATRDIPAFDLAAACSGFMYGLETAGGFIASGNYRRILVLGSDALTPFTNWKDRASCILFGDGAGAAVVEATDNPDEGILAGDIGARGKNWALLKVDGGGSGRPGPRLLKDPSLEPSYYIQMQGNEVFKIVTRIVIESCNRVLERAGLTAADIDFVVPHQANIRIINYVAEKLNLPMEKVGVTIHKYGNNSGASVPVTLCESVREGKIKKGDRVLLTGFGGGLTYASMLMKWAY